MAFFDFTEKSDIKKIMSGFNSNFLKKLLTFGFYTDKAKEAAQDELNRRSKVDNKQN